MITKKSSLCLLVTLFAFPLFYTYAGEVKLTTYYPAPHGEYKTIKTTSNTHLATDPDAKVGIGTTNPVEKLDINGNIIFGASNAISANLYWDTALPGWRYKDNGYGGSLDFNAQNGGLGIAVAPQNTAGPGADARAKCVYALTVTPGANVGIGTELPQTPAPNGQAAGNLDANDVYLRSTGNWMSQGASGVLRMIAYDQFDSPPPNQKQVPSNGSLLTVFNKNITLNTNDNLLIIWSLNVVSLRNVGGLGCNIYIDNAHVIMGDAVQSAKDGGDNTVGRNFVIPKLTYTTGSHNIQLKVATWDGVPYDIHRGSIIILAF